jgi:hypothetical protein
MSGMASGAGGMTGEQAAVGGVTQLAGALSQNQPVSTGMNMQQYIDRMKGSPYGRDVLGRSIWPQSYMDQLSGLANGTQNGPTVNLLQQLLLRQQGALQSQGLNARSQGTGGVLRQGQMASDRAGLQGQAGIQAAKVQEQQQAQNMQAQMLMQQQQMNDNAYLANLQNMMQAYANQGTQNPGTMQNLGGLARAGAGKLASGAKDVWDSTLGNFDW